MGKQMKRKQKGGFLGFWEDSSNNQPTSYTQTSDSGGLFGSLFGSSSNSNSSNNYNRSDSSGGMFSTLGSYFSGNNTSVPNTSVPNTSVPNTSVPNTSTNMVPNVNNNYGGKKTKKKRGGNGYKSSLPLDYYATPVSGIKTVGNISCGKGGSRRRHKKQHSRSKRRHRK
jgi:hypothetical protein